MFLVAWVVFFVFGFVVFSPFLVCNACGCVVLMILGLFGTFTSVGFLISKCAPQVNDKMPKSLCHSHVYFFWTISCSWVFHYDYLCASCH